MASNPNVNDFKQTWSNIYQLAHYKVPAYRAIADESMRADLTKGQILHRTYDTDFIVNDMGGDGGYTDQAWTDSDETLTVNYEKETSFFIKDLDAFQANLPLQQRKATKAMNAIFLRIDADVLSLAYQGAGSTVDAGSIGGNSGEGITLTVGNVQAVCAAAETALRLANVIYNPAATFDGKFSLGQMMPRPVAVISAQFYSIILQYLAGKYTQLGDDVSRNGFVGKYFNFNLFVSNNLAWTGNLVLATNPTDGDTFTLNSGVTNLIGGTPTSQAVTFRFVDTLAQAGDVHICSTAAKTVTNLVNALSAPYTSIAETVDTGYTAFTQSNLTTSQQKLFIGSDFTQTNPATTSGTTLSALITGVGNVPVSVSMTAAGNLWTATEQVQHNIFGVDRSISVVIQKQPNLDILQANPQPNSGNSGRVGKDFVTWCAYGIKVFNDQSPMLVDVQIRTDAFTSAPVNQA